MSALVPFPPPTPFVMFVVSVGALIWIVVVVLAWALNGHQVIINTTTSTSVGKRRCKDKHHQQCEKNKN
jgi:hypothetical protein